MDQIRRVHPGLRKGLDCKLVLRTSVSFGQGVDIMIEHDWTWGFIPEYGESDVANQLDFQDFGTDPFKHRCSLVSVSCVFWATDGQDWHCKADKQRRVWINAAWIHKIFHFFVTWV